MVKGREITEATIVFDRNVKASELNLITEGFCGEVVIIKKIIVDENLNIGFDLFVLGGVAKKSPISDYKLKIDGDFYCYGDIHCNSINVRGCFVCEGIIYSKDIIVGENFVCYDEVDVFGSRIVVVGDFEALAVKADTIIVMNKITVYNSMSANCVKTGY